MDASISNKSNVATMFNKFINFWTCPAMCFAFACVYLLHSFLSFNFITARVAFLTYESMFISVWGILIIVFSLFNLKQYKFNKIFIVLLLFLLSFIVSSLVAYKYGLSNNIKGFIWLSMETVVLFGLNRNSITGKWIKWFFIIFVIISTIYALISLLMAFIGYVYIPKGSTGDISRGGMFYGRLFGLYADCNYGAVTSCLTIYVVAYLSYLSATKGKIKIVLPAILCFIHFFYFSLTGSRTGIVVFCFSVIIMVFVIVFRLLKKKYKSINIFIRICQCAVCSIVSAVLIIGICVFMEFAYESAEPKIAASLGGTVSDPSHLFLGYFADNVKEACGISTDATTQDASSAHVGLLGRNESDLSNQRFGQWKSAIEIVQKSPLFGASNRNLLAFATDVLPDSYIVYEGFESLHNVFFDVLASQGIVGFILWSVFSLLLFIRIIKTIRKSSGSYFIICNIFLAMFIVVFGTAMFYSEILYVNTIGSVFFWFVFGTFSKDENLLKEV